jgi:diphthamide synthase (EF-2-diphthine--ammonia ligase)
MIEEPINQMPVQEVPMNVEPVVNGRLASRYQVLPGKKVCCMDGLQSVSHLEKGVEESVVPMRKVHIKALI